MLKYGKQNFAIKSVCGPAEELDREYMQLARYITEIVGPRIFSRTAAVKNIHVFRLHRFHFAVHNLLLNWLFFMFSADKVYLSYFELAKCHNSNAISNIVFAPCGMMTDITKKMVLSHLGNK